MGEITVWYSLRSRNAVISHMDMRDAHAEILRTISPDSALRTCTCTCKPWIMVRLIRATRNVTRSSTSRVVEFTIYSPVQVIACGVGMVRCVV